MDVVRVCGRHVGVACHLVVRSVWCGRHWPEVHGELVGTAGEYSPWNRPSISIWTNAFSILSVDWMELKKFAGGGFQM